MSKAENISDSNQQEFTLNREDDSLKEDISKKEKDIERNVSEFEEILESLPEEQRSEIVSAFFARTHSSYSSPFPPPKILKEYNEFFPGSAERIFNMVESQQKHRIEMEKMIVNKQLKQSGYGQVFGFILAIMFGIIALILGYTNHDYLAGIIGGATIIGLAIIFVLNKKPNDSTNEEDDD